MGGLGVERARDETRTGPVDYFRRGGVLVQAEETKGNKRRNIVIAIAVLTIGAFLAGYVPQYLKASGLREELRVRDERIAAMQREARISQGQGLAGLLLLELSRKNYGIAGQHASAFFDHVRGMIDDPGYAGAKSALEPIAAQRDAVVSGIAKADPAVDAVVSSILESMHKLRP